MSEPEKPTLEPTFSALRREASHVDESRARHKENVPEQFLRREVLRPQPRPDHVPDLRHHLRDDDDDRRRRRRRSRGEGAPAHVEPDDALADIETDDNAIADDDDETFLESEEEDGGDVSGIIGGPVPEGDEEP
jgi:hypothetical protein